MTSFTPTSKQQQKVVDSKAQIVVYYGGNKESRQDLLVKMLYTLEGKSKHWALYFEATSETNMCKNYERLSNLIGKSHDGEWVYPLGNDNKLIPVFLDKGAEVWDNIAGAHLDLSLISEAQEMTPSNLDYIFTRMRSENPNPRVVMCIDLGEIDKLLEHETLSSNTSTSKALMNHLKSGNAYSETPIGFSLGAREEGGAEFSFREPSKEEIDYGSAISVEFIKCD